MSIANVQRKTAGTTAAAAASLSAVFDAAPTVGNLLICYANSDAPLTMTSTGWTPIESNINATGLYIWGKAAGASESATVTVTPSVTDTIAMVIEEWSGLAGGAFAAILDVHANANGASTGTTAATAQPDELAVVAVGCSGSSGTDTVTWTNGFIHNAGVLGGPGGSSIFLGVGSRILTASGAQSSVPSNIINSTFTSAAMIATFKAFVTTTDPVAARSSYGPAYAVHRAATI